MQAKAYFHKIYFKALLRLETMKVCFDPMDKTGTSNVASGAIRLTMDRPAMLIMAPRKRLEEVIHVLLQPPQKQKNGIRIL
jgi:hypothetical protein